MVTVLVRLRGGGTVTGEMIQQQALDLIQLWRGGNWSDNCFTIGWDEGYFVTLTTIRFAEVAAIGFRKELAHADSVPA